MLVLAIPLPFCIQDKVNSLRYIGTASVCAVLVNVAFFIGYCFIQLGRGNDPVRSDAHVDALPVFGKNIWGHFRAAGAICFAFSAANNLFPAVRP
jgi:hypothetical protein